MKEEDKEAEKVAPMNEASGLDSDADEEKTDSKKMKSKSDAKQIKSFDEVHSLFLD